MKSPMDYLHDLIECTQADCCDGRAELCVGNGCGDKPVDDQCCKTERGDELKPTEPEETPHNGDLPTREISDSVLQNSRETCPFPQNTLRVTSNDGGWLWVLGIQGSLKEENYPMRQALKTLKRNSFLLF